jgi:predicted porin
MKKQLLTSTALVAAGVMAVSGSALAQGPKLTVGGEMRQIFGVGSNSDAYEAAELAAGRNGRVGFDQHSDAEIHFNGSVTLDNGIKIATRVELEGNSTQDKTAGKESNITNGAPNTTGDGDFIDENWMRISGSFGEIRLGSGDAAGMAMTTGYLGTWSTGVGLNHAFDVTDWVTQPTTVSASTVARVDSNSDAEHISYFTPRISGFQFGASYVPSTEEDVNNQRANKTAGDTDGISVGVNYVGNYNGAGIGIAAGYGTSNESNADRSDPEVWGIGGRVDFQGFRVAMSYVDKKAQNNAAGVTAAGGQGQETFEMGIRYSFGPNAVSFTYQDAETDGDATSAADGDQTTAATVAYRRTLAPGVNWDITAIYADFDDGLAAAAAGNSNDGTALATSMTLRF